MNYLELIVERHLRRKHAMCCEVADDSLKDFASKLTFRENLGKSPVDMERLPEPVKNMISSRNVVLANKLDFSFLYSVSNPTSKRKSYVEFTTGSTEK